MIDVIIIILIIIILVTELKMQIPHARTITAVNAKMSSANAQIISSGGIRTKVGRCPNHETIKYKIP
jgi:hypothetical protein